MRCAVLGSPVAHSLSPVLHLAAYRELGLDWTYGAHKVEEPELSGFMELLTPEWRGLSLTMPLKRRVIDFLDRVEARAGLLASVNTVVIGSTGRHGYNTDVLGFVRAFQEAGVLRLASVVVVGAGATAASALAAAADLGATRATVLARSTARASRLAGLGLSLGLEVELRDLADPASVPLADALVSTIPVDAQHAVPTEALASQSRVVFEVSYRPSRTPLTEAARAEDRQVIGGFELLLHQAARQVELMTSVERAPLEAMRTAGLAALAAG